MYPTTPRLLLNIHRVIHPTPTQVPLTPTYPLLILTHILTLQHYTITLPMATINSTLADRLRVDSPAIHTHTQCTAVD